MSQPMLYYNHNVVAAVNLIEAMRKHSLKNVSVDLRRSIPSPSALLSIRMSAEGHCRRIHRAACDPGGGNAWHPTADGPADLALQTLLLLINIA